MCGVVLSFVRVITESASSAAAPAAVAHSIVEGTCTVCIACGQCTGQGASCANHDPSRARGVPCGCGLGSAGCEKCQTCETCTATLEWYDPTRHHCAHRVAHVDSHSTGVVPVISRDSDRDHFAHEYCPCSPANYYGDSHRGTGITARKPSCFCGLLSVC